ncbi:BBX high mobility group box domain containing [Rhinolophus ferrumequinum]|uniref:BBX high mobility group box domain containing n=1 Tax=Rhinolophus ferrumequinum TaxID=59479 RepID=A0A7J8ADF0_RHIFE|nr:BBX high mobility group box domain containing [Rhinolophus ferrumequinum]
MLLAPQRYPLALAGLIFRNPLKCVRSHHYFSLLRYLQVHPTPALLQNSVRHQPCFSLLRCVWHQRA